VLSAILGAMIGLVGFVVTVTVLLVQTSTGQFSARYLRLVYRDRLLKTVLAVLVGTFAYSFVLLRRVGETESPDFGLVVVGGLVLLGVVLFLVFFSGKLHRLRPVAVAASVGALGTEAFLGVARSTATNATNRELPVADAHAILGTRTGTIQAVSLDGLVRGRTITRARSCSVTAWGISSTRARRSWTSVARRRRRMPLEASKAWSRSGRSERSRRILRSPFA
jgi:uncharacterized membrane protein